MEDRQLVAIVPSPRQLALQEMGFYGFIHFSINTFTDREWGDGTDSPALFAPARLDARQWARCLRSAGMKGMILTCKHHDGFCLWPSRATDYTVAASPYRQDVVAQAAEACRAEGLRFGVYLSPWDRNQPLYGTGRPYDDFFVHQLTELLTGYGEICSVWLDGACGEGPNGRRQRYDWERYYRTIRTLQPEACIHVCGPDIRWCGNEAGDTRESEWSVVPRRTRDTEKIASMSQQADGADFRLRTIRAQDRDLGSREILKNETDLVWYPAEVNTSIRPGWFYHPAEDGQVKPLEKLLEIYEKSVGGNAAFLLNVPPDREGRVHAADARRLQELGDALRARFAHNLLPEACEITASPARPGCEIKHVLCQDEAYYMPCGDAGEWQVTVRWDAPQRIGYVLLREQLRLSQRIERFALEAWVDGAWQRAAAGTVVGSRRIVNLHGQCVQGLRLRVLDSRLAPALRFFGAYEAARETI